MPRDTYEEFKAIADHIGRRTGDMSDPEAAAAKLIPWLGIIGIGEAGPEWRGLRRRDGEPTTWPAVEEVCRDAIRRSGAWIGGKPATIAALIDDIAWMDPSHEETRRAVLTEAWAHLLAA